MTPEDLKSLQRRLRELREEIQSMLDASETGAAPVALDEPIGRLSRVDALQQQNMTKSNRDAARLRIQQVESALLRFDDEEYGECLRCGEEIGLPRLEVKPEATLCIVCQSRQEAGAR